MKDYFGYKGKRVVITGAASGIGQSAAMMLVDLGAEVYALDVKNVTIPVKQYIKTNLMEKESIDAAIDQIPDNLHALFNCAGISGVSWSQLDMILVNFVGHRYLTESLLPKIQDGGAIAFVSSQAGVNWRNKLDTVKPLLATHGFNKARAWLKAHEEEISDGYSFSKQCICAYAKVNCKELAKRLIRINCILPTLTKTAMMPEFDDDRVIYQGEVFVGKDLVDYVKSLLAATQPFVGRIAEPEEQAEPLVFLNSSMARFISGENICVDFGFVASTEAGQTTDVFGVGSSQSGTSFSAPQGVPSCLAIKSGRKTR